MRGGRLWRRGNLGSDADRAAFRALHQASLASPALREGLTTTSAERAIRHLRNLLGTPALAITDTESVLAWDGVGSQPDWLKQALIREGYTVDELRGPAAESAVTATAPGPDGVAPGDR